MPSWDGFGVLEELQAARRAIVFVTAHESLP